MNLEFKKLTAEDVGILNRYYGKRHDQTCDSVILDNFLWNEYYEVCFATVGEDVLLWTMTIHGKRYAALPVCKEEDLPRYLDLLRQYFNETLNLPLEIYLADEPAVEFLNLSPDKYSVEELPDSRDYLYSAEALRTLGGKELRKKRNHLNAFGKRYEGRYEYRTLCCSDSHEVWNFLVRWREQKGQEVEGHLDYEVHGIHEILKNCSILNVRMGGVYIDGELEAFSVGTYNEREKMAVISIEKANPDFAGLYQYINQQLLIHEFPDAELVNREDDMGLPGLRQAKMSYAPIGFAKKYRIRQIL